MAYDLAPIAGSTVWVPPAGLFDQDDPLIWGSAEIRVQLLAKALPTLPRTADSCSWSGRWRSGPRIDSGRLDPEITDQGSVVIPATTTALDAVRIAEELSGRSRPPPRSCWAVADRPQRPAMATRSPPRTVFLPPEHRVPDLFGRDSRAARMLLRATMRTRWAPCDPGPAGRHDARRGHSTAPGKILHELRRRPSSSPTSPPPVYYGTIDATPLWSACCTTPGGPGADRPCAGCCPRCGRAALDGGLRGRRRDGFCE